MIRLWFAVTMLNYWVRQQTRALDAHDRAKKKSAEWDRRVALALQQLGD